MTPQELLFSFEGRINRAKFWLVMLCATAVGAPLNLAALANPRDPIWLVLSVIWSMIVIYPALALYTKRWHDRDKSGWWSLILFVPIVGPIWFVIELGILRGTAGPNRFGPDPLDAAQAGSAGFGYDGRPQTDPPVGGSPGYLPPQPAARYAGEHRSHASPDSELPVHAQQLSELPPLFGAGRAAPAGDRDAAPGGRPTLYQPEATGLAYTILWYPKGQRREAKRLEISTSQPRTITVGRSSNNAMVLASDTVSRLHAQIVVDKGSVEIVDNSSSNGTYLDGQRVRSARWQAGQIARIGDFDLELVRE